MPLNDAMTNMPNRRDLLKGLSAATLSALAAGAPRAWADTPAAAEPAAARPKATADSMIVLWMGGAMAQTESFDPKRVSEYKPGLETRSLICTTPPIDTVVDNIKFCQGVEHMAKLMDRGALIRSYVARDYGAMAEDLQHIPFQYKWHTGYTTPSTVPAPFLGAWASKVLGPLNPDLPPYIEICRSEKTANVFLSLGAFNPAGFFGAEHGPLFVPDPKTAVETIASRLPAARFEARQAAFRRAIAASPVSELASSYQKESIVNSMESAYRLMRSPSVKAFDLSTEPKAVYDEYNTGQFGLGCLLARRLVEARARFVEVHVDFENAKGWDTHSDGHTGQMAMKKTIDRPVARLIRDLEERGLLDRTLVVLATEFGRAAAGRGSTKAKTLSKPSEFGLHGHFGSAASLLMFGGGVRKGVVYGKTRDEFPCDTVEDPVFIHDLHATFYRCLGINPRTAFDVEKRPFYVTRDGKGKPIPAVLA